MSHLSEALAFTAPTPVRRKSAWWRLASSHPGLLVGGALVGFVVVLGALAPLLATHPPQQVVMTERFTPPRPGHWLGTDHLGRDIWSRIVYGGQLSLFVGVVVATAACAAGTALGLIGGYSRAYGELVMRVIDGLMAFPGIVLGLALIAVLGARLSNVIFALSVVYAPRIARVMHAVVLELKEREYTTAATALGATGTRVLARHVLPNAVGPLTVEFSFNFASAIVSEASLSFLGVGLPPGTPSWGVVLSEGRNYMLRAPWITLLPGLAIFVTVMGLNLLGDSLRDLLDPRLRGAGRMRRE
jgi:peptide/nickel transport system permease protein